jgi:hypothetical protein
VENKKYLMCVGECAIVGRSDDSATCITHSVSDALAQALGWAAEMEWPESDSSYDACVWVELDGEIVGEESVIIYADGRSCTPA